MNIRSNLDPRFPIPIKRILILSFAPVIREALAAFMAGIPIETPAAATGVLAIKLLLDSLVVMIYVIG
jgi:hypothetical protein